jgi:hypothetical protein
MATGRIGWHRHVTPGDLFKKRRQRIVGSDLLSLQTGLYQREHPSTEQIDAGAAIYSTFEHLQSVDLALYLSIAPGFQDGISDCCHILPHCPRESSYPMNVGRACVGQPYVESFDSSTAEQASEAHRQMAHSAEIGGRCL